MRVHAIEILALPGARTKALVRQRRSLTRVTQPYYYCCSCTHQQRARARARERETECVRASTRKCESRQPTYYSR